MAVQFDRLVRAAADHDFLAWVIAEAADGQPLIAVRLEPAAAGRAEVRGDGPQGPRSFDQQRGDRPASRRRQQDHVGKVLRRHVDMLTGPAA